MPRLDRPDEIARAAVRVLAGLAAVEPGARALRRLWGDAAATAVSPTEGLDLLAEAVRPTSTRVGIWDARCGDGPGLGRRADLAGEWRLWADVDRIRPKGDEPRVALLGESAARGYFYDPLATPAALLASMLGAGGRGPVDVVDLARTDAGVDDLMTIVREVAVLEPDAIVLFAGNNWHQFGDGAEERAALAAALRLGEAEARRLFAERVSFRVAALLDVLALVARVRAIPVVVVVPEFNLAGWRDRAGEEWRRIAEERERSGDLAGVRPALEAARDAPCGTFLPHSPRCTRAVTDLLRAKAAQHGFALVDLPARLATSAGARLPDPEMFLDYCHLTWDGHTVTMAEVAARLCLPLLGGERSAATFAADAPRPSDAGESVARVLAAAHNQRHGQPRATVLAHCTEALRRSPAAKETVRRYVDFRARRAPDWMCASFREAAAHRGLARYFDATGRHTDDHGDLALVETMLEALRAEGHETEAAIELLVAEHALGDGETDLLQAPFRVGAFAARQVTAHLRAVASESGFHFVVAAPADVLLSVCARLGSDAPAAATVEVNGHDVVRIDLDGRWRTHDLGVPARSLRRGLNRLVVRWPAEAGDVRAAPRRAAAALERGEVPNRAPVFGEVAALSARLRT